METKLKDIRDYLYMLQGDFESITTDEELMYQSIRVSQRVRALLNIYQQMVEQNRLFDEDYLKKYLQGGKLWQNLVNQKKELTMLK